MTGGLGAVAAGAHIAPAAQPVLGGVEKHPVTARIGAATNAIEFAVDQRIGSGLHNRDDETRERVAGGYERAGVGGIGVPIDSAGAGAPAQHPIHLCHGIVADAHGAAAALGQHAQGRADAARVNQRGGCGGWLQQGPSTNTSGTLFVECSARCEPRQECIEVAQEIAVRNLRGGVRIHELEPEAGA